jgi:hypothetical protein
VARLDPFKRMKTIWCAMEMDGRPLSSTVLLILYDSQMKKDALISVG